MVPEGWVTKKLSDMALIKRGAGSQYLNYVEQPCEGIRLIRISDFLGDNPKFVEHTDDMNRFLLDKGDLLIAGTGATAGITFEVPENYVGFAFSYNAPRIRIKVKTVNKKYVLYFLKSNSILRQQYSLFTGNAQPFLDTKAIGNFNIFLPPLSEQRKIATILSTWDKAIEKQEALINAKQQRKRALMQQLLTGKKRFKEFEGLEWQAAKLADFFKEISIKNQDSEDLTVLSCSKVYGIVPQTQIFDKRVASKDTKRYKIVEKNNLVYDPMLLWDASIGFVESVNKGVISPAYNTYQFSHKSAVRDYFKYLLQTYRFRETYKVISQGTNVRRKKAPSKAFLGIEFKLPPTIEEQDKIASVFLLIDNEIQTLTTQLDAFKQQKRGLMQQLLTGKKRVQVDEVAT